MWFIPFLPVPSTEVSMIQMKYEQLLEVFIPSFFCTSDFTRFLSRLSFVHLRLVVSKMVDSLLAFLVTSFGGSEAPSFQNCRFLIRLFGDQFWRF